MREQEGAFVTTVTFWGNLGGMVEVLVGGSKGLMFCHLDGAVRLVAAAQLQRRWIALTRQLLSRWSEQREVTGKHYSSLNTPSG